MGQAVRARARYRLDEYATGIAEPDVSAERGLSSSHRPSSWRFPSPIVVRRPCTSARPTIGDGNRQDRSEEHTSELQSLMRNSYAVFCWKKKKKEDNKQKKIINT